MVPVLITRILSWTTNNTTPSDLSMESLSEDIKILIMLPSSAPDKQKSQLLQIILATLTALLDAPPFDSGVSTVHSTVIPHILSIATSSPQAFRDAVMLLPGNIRSQLEASVRNMVSSQQQQNEKRQKEIEQRASRTDDGKQPTIQLKMDFNNFS
ncbi:uncharacterized protein BX664DRAFT_72755 [Halteromyces radiatus]|uniref:uncharacterized protein n=1 Tax=Halteromyces radiatus TaxID=101107 RepID=UPI00221FDBDE|nr:uncharacterized protein BX664DRAFT_72755 [Halteromyces radiatus]KAI8097096.1 hypothetical protein BX664DRAFT_72755 [Halteromyces radiatus]